MSDKPRFPATEAKAVAVELMRWLDPACERLVVAGSLRREKPTVGDVEIMYVPITGIGPDPSDMFAAHEVNFTDEVIATMEKEGVLERRKNVAGRETFGPLNKLMRHRASGIPVDLFSEPNLADWWRSLVMRTGPKELNLRLITTASKRGVRVHAYGTGLTDLHGNPIACESEEQFFEICGAKYLEPKDRR
jgi:DNA polymerase/3'-5' exonuclease PolX